MNTLTIQDIIRSLMPEDLKQRANTKEARGLCLKRGCEAKAEPGCRKRCRRHYNQFVNDRRRAGPAGSRERLEFDLKAVASGEIARENRGRKRTS